MEDHRTDRLGVLLDQLDFAREIAQAHLDGLASPASLPKGAPLPLTPILEQRIGPYRLPMVISKRSRRPSHHGTWISGRSAERRTGL